MFGSKFVRVFAALLGSFFFSLGANCNLLHAESTWELRGIGGGGALFSATISPHDPDLLYMATDMTAMFRSDNFGTSWETLPFHQLAGGVDTHIRFTSDPNVLYSINSPQDVYGSRIPVRSNDGGQTWSPLGANPTSNGAFMLHTDPNDTQRLLVSDWSKIYYSDNGGTSFTTAYDSNDSGGSGIHLAGTFFDGDDIYIGTNQGLIASSNAGTSFAPSTAGGIPASEGFVSFAGSKSGGETRFFGLTIAKSNLWGGIVGSEVTDTGNLPKVYRLNGNDTDWSLVRDYVPNSHKPFFVRMAENNSDIAYLAGIDQSTGNPTVLKTSNGGSSWDPVFNTVGNQNVTTGWQGSGGDLEWYWGETALGFAVSPNDPNRVMITDFGYVHVTDDGGANWQQAYVEPATENPAGSSTPKGGAYTTNGVEQTAAWWMHWASPQTILTGFSDIRGTRSTDGGHTWTVGSAIGLPHNATYHYAEHPTTGRLYAATSTAHDMYQSTYLSDARIDGADGHIMTSSDDGASWQLLHDFNHPVVWLAQNQTNTETLYASVAHSTQGGIFVTHDLSNPSGPSFTRLNSPARTEGHPFNVHILDDGNLLASWSGRRDPSGAFTASSGVFLSEDGGATWSDRSDPSMMRWTKDVVVDPHDPDQDTWYAAVFSHWGSAPNDVGGLYRTDDRGINWEELGDFYRVHSIAVDPNNPDFAYVTTETDGLWITENLTDDTPTFSLDETYPFMQPVRVFFNPHNPGEVWAASFGGGLRVLLSSPDGNADFNGDGTVNAADLAKWQNDFGGPGSDTDGDGDSDGADFLTWQRQLGSATAVTAIPEPVTSCLLFLGLIGSVFSSRILRIGF